LTTSVFILTGIYQALDPAVLNIHATITFASFILIGKLIKQQVVYQNKKILTLCFVFIFSLQKAFIDMSGTLLDKIAGASETFN